MKKLLLLPLLLMLLLTKLSFAQESVDEFAERLIEWVKLSEEEKILNKNAILFEVEDIINLVDIMEKENLDESELDDYKLVDDEFLLEMKSGQCGLIYRVNANLDMKRINPKEIKYLFVKNVEERIIKKNNKGKVLTKDIKGELYFSYNKKIFKMDFKAFNYAETYKLLRSNNIWEVDYK